MDVKQKIHVSLDKLSALPFVASKSNLFLNCCSYYLVISVKIFLLTMHYIHRGPLGVLAVTEVADAHRAALRNASSTSSTTRRVPAPGKSVAASLLCSWSWEARVAWRPMAVVPAQAPQLF